MHCFPAYMYTVGAYSQRFASTTSSIVNLLLFRLPAESFFSSSIEQNAREWTRAWLKARDGKGTKKESPFFFSGCRPRFSRLAARRSLTRVVNWRKTGSWQKRETASSLPPFLLRLTSKKLGDKLVLLHVRQDMLPGDASSPIWDSQNQTCLLLQLLKQQNTWNVRVSNWSKDG